MCVFKVKERERKTRLPTQWCLCEVSISLVSRALGKWRRRGYGRWQAGNHQQRRRERLRKSYESRSLYGSFFLPFPSSFKFDYWMGKSTQGHKQTAILKLFFLKGGWLGPIYRRQTALYLVFKNPSILFFIASSTCLSKQNHFTRNIQEVSSLEKMSGWFILKFPLHPSPSRN